MARRTASNSAASATSDRAKAARSGTSRAAQRKETQATVEEGQEISSNGEATAREPPALVPYTLCRFKIFNPDPNPCIVPRYSNPLMIAFVRLPIAPG